MSVTGFLRDTPIKRKVTLVILLTSAVGLFLLGSALITYEFITFRRGLAVNISVAWTNPHRIEQHGRPCFSRMRKART